VARIREGRGHKDMVLDLLAYAILAEENPEPLARVYRLFWRAPSSSDMKTFMISEREKKIILDIARKYRASRVLLFGSAVSHEEDYQDIDIGVEGIADDQFYSFYGELMLELPKPVDVIDLSKSSKFTELVRREGIALNA
jgi:predicted nucleotidyltransferase